MHWVPEFHPRGRLAEDLSPAGGAAVMSTGIVGSAAAMAGLEVLSWVLLALAVVAEVALGAVMVTRLLTDRRAWLTEAATPASLTAVAATAVIGENVGSLGWARISWVLLAAATALWLLLMPIVLAHWVVPTEGTCFLVCVATEALAVLAGTVGRLAGNAPIVVAGLVAFVLGLVLYALVIARYDWRQFAVGTGDQWVVAGALAITSLAGAELIRAGDRLRLFAEGRNLLALADFAFWGLALAGYAVLVGAEVRWPRHTYDIHRWATVFPMGMTSAACFSVAAAEGVPAIAGLGRVLFWPALLAWAVTVAGAAGVRVPRGLTGGEPPSFR